ncbi:MAG TPA: type II secretion system F family protein [Candidatus Paceibacterota bacterium]|nr:type II secretion system F family protein [Candidatus Paceibacterota bacterium]HPT40384.1 type II secretion system F family protein [Candidatus Paceibacterota bacterium]
MAKFRYTARNELGEVQAGLVEAASRDLAIRILQENKLYILALETTEKKKLSETIFGFFKKVNVKDLMLFTRQFSTLISAEVTISDALRTLHKQISKPVLKDAIFDVYTDVEGGLYLSQALSKHPNVFSDFYVNMVRSAEVSGRLEQTLLFLADYLEREMKLNSKVKGAMIYPIFVIGVFVAVLGIVVTFVIPQLQSIFTEVNAELPVLTRILMSAGGFLSDWGWIILIFLAIAIVFAIRYFRSEEGKQVWDEIILSIPVIGGLNKKIAITRMSTSINVLLKGGLPIASSLEISGRVVDNTVFQRILNETAEDIRKGGTISGTFSRYPDYFPPMVTQMIVIGENSGKIDELLEKVSSFYNEEVQNTINNAVELIQPILIVFLGVFIGLFVAAVLIPIYNLAQVF